MNPHQAKEYLNTFINYEIAPIENRNSFKLDRVKRLLADLNYPHQKFISLHVAGTKGKGSTCAFIASILQAAGFSVGLYTSPHLESYHERIRLLAPDMRSSATQPFVGSIREENLTEALNAIRPFADEIQKTKALGRLTFFEIFTVAALYIFHKSKMDFVVLETGLGGRLDATNVVDAKVCGLTPISLEHTQFLGSTIGAIAAEKAAIIKNKFQSAVISEQSDEARRVIQDHCRSLNVKAQWVGEDIQVFPKEKNFLKQTFSVQTRREKYEDLETRMAGDHQTHNAALAIGMIEYFQHVGYQISKESIVKGISNMYWPGRFEILQESPLIVVDGAHTPLSARVLVQAVRELLVEQKVVLIVGFSDDKDMEGIARELNPLASRVIFTKARHPRAAQLDRKKLEELFLQKDFVMTDSVLDALKSALKNIQPNEMVLITGSLFVVGEARKLCIS